MWGKSMKPRSLLGLVTLLLALATGNGKVSYEQTTHRLYYVPFVQDIDDSAPTTPSSDYEDVDAHQLSNDMGIVIKAIARGGNMVEVSKNGTNYVWENVNGGTYYGGKNETLGIDPNAFPLKRGLILHGGSRFAAVTAEHGLYFDSEWDVSVDRSKDEEKSITLSIVDDQATRDAAKNLTPNSHPWVAKGFGQGQYNRQDQNTPSDFLTKYPVTNMKYSFTISLRQDEDFVRLRMSVTNSDPTEVKVAEAWLSMLFPITEESIILARQDVRWRRDTWLFEDLPHIVTWKNHPLYDTPLKWPASGIFYDFPRKQGLFHGVVTDPAKGQGVVYVSPEEGPPTFTKMWSWGDKSSFDRQSLVKTVFDPNSDVGARTGAALQAGRPATDYYEPWTSSTNFAFFQTSEFEPMTEYSWEIAILPIDEGLTSSNKEDLLSVVDDKIEEHSTQLSDLEPVKVTPLNGDGDTESPTKAPTDGDTDGDTESPTKAPTDGDTDGDTESPTKAPSVEEETASCSAHPRCSAVMDNPTGNCCPNDDGVYLDCCINYDLPESAICSSNEGCVTKGVVGYCCPTAVDVVLDCCDVGPEVDVSEKYELAAIGFEEESSSTNSVFSLLGMVVAFFAMILVSLIDL